MLKAELEHIIRAASAITALDGQPSQVGRDLPGVEIIAPSLQAARVNELSDD